MYEVIIIGGSYSGLSAAMALGRSKRKVLIIDSGKPCNRFTPYSHNFITHDGKTPAEIALTAKEQVLKYPTVEFIEDKAIFAERKNNGFIVKTESGESFETKKLLFATGVEDILSKIEGLLACWGKSVIHCPYCHGYEVKDKSTGILGNGDAAMHYAMLINQLTTTITIFTNGPHKFTTEQLQKLNSHNIAIVEDKVSSINHTDGFINSIVTEKGSKYLIKALYTRPGLKQHCTLPQDLGCAINEHGYIVTDEMQKTTIDSIYASGDCTSQVRSVATAVASGMMAGAAINFALCSEAF